MANLFDIWTMFVSFNNNDRKWKWWASDSDTTILYLSDCFLGTNNNVNETKVGSAYRSQHALLIRMRWVEIYRRLDGRIIIIWNFSCCIECWWRFFGACRPLPNFSHLKRTQSRWMLDIEAERNRLCDAVRLERSELNMKISVSKKIRTANHFGHQSAVRPTVYQKKYRFCISHFFFQCLGMSIEWPH